MKSIGYLAALDRPLAHYRDDGHWPPPVSEEPVSAEAISAWRIRWGATCSDKVARLLTMLERDYTIGAATARSGGPSA